MGGVSAACLSQEGHKIIGVDFIQKKVRINTDGKILIVEAGLDPIIQSARNAGLLPATTDSSVGAKN